MAVSTAAVGAVGVGFLVMYAGLKGISIPAALQGIIQGKSPAGAARSNQIPIAADIANAAAAASGSVALGTGTAPGAAPVVSGNYTHAQLMQLWQSVGGSAATANNAACHAIQESSGNPTATSRNPDGGTNVGLWQLDTPGGKGAGYSVQQLMDPVTNARVALAGSNGGRDWSAWATPGC